MATLHVSYFYDGLSTRTRKYIEEASILAEFSDCNKRHGCVIVKHGRIVGRGYNRHRNDPNIMSPEHILTGSSIHAEIAALRSAGAQAKDADLYVVRIGAKGDLLLSRPCLRCYNEIHKAGIVEISHS